MRISDWSSDVCSSDLCGWRDCSGATAVLHGMTPTSCKGSTMRPRPVPTTLALALLSILAGGPALAQDAAPETAAPAQAQASTLDTGIVTGTRVSDRTVAESQSPIDFIPPEALPATRRTDKPRVGEACVRTRRFPWAPTHEKKQKQKYN